MSFDPSLPKDGINVSPTHPLREALLLVAGIVGVATLAVVVLAAATDLLVPRLPPDLEATIFSASWVSDEESAEHDPRSAYLQALVDDLARDWPDNPYRFRVAVWDEPEPNALALPGGWIAVTSGLLDGVESENELAFVLGHEIGHFRNRDHLRGIGRGLAFSLVLGAVSATGASGVIQLAGLAGQLADRGFGREQERDADVTGLELVQARYGHVHGAGDFFRRLPDAGVESGASRVVGYFSTHPLSDERIRAIQALATERGWTTEGPLAPLPAWEDRKPPQAARSEP
jgi:predicted Zn-dependent protease